MRDLPLKGVFEGETSGLRGMRSDIAIGIAVGERGNGRVELVIVAS